MKVKRIPQIDLFASRLNHQLPKYMPWHPDPDSCAVDSIQHTWRNLQRYAFPPFCLIRKVLAKVRKDQSLLVIVTPAWQTQSWYAALFAMSVQHPIILSNLTTLTRSSGAKAPFAGRQPASWWHGRFQESFGRLGSIKTRCHTYHKFQKVRVNI